jgi:transcriptional regulator with XRE-family HTH domain
MYTLNLLTVGGIMKKKLSPFNKKLREARVAKGLTMRELSRMVGISNGYISVLETNPKANLSAIKLVAFSKALEVPIEYLSNDKITSIKDSDLDTVFFSKYRRLDEKCKGYMRKIVKCFE